MAEVWFQEKFENLQIDDEKTDKLSELSIIYEKLQTLSTEDIALVSKNHVPLSSIYYSCVGSSSEQTTVACDILSLCLSSLDLNTETGTSVLLEDMIRHPNENVKIIGLTQLERMLKKHPDVQSRATILDVIRCLELSSSEVGTLAMKVLNSQLPKHFDSAEVRNALDAACASSSTPKCRVYELVARMAATSVSDLRRSEQVIDRIISDISSDDVLLQLNIMEILSVLVATEHGLAYLEDQGLFPRLLAALEHIDLMHLLFPGFIKFFGSVSYAHPDKIFVKYAHLCKPLFETIISNDSSTLSACLDTLGLLGRTKEGKIGLSGLALVCPEGDMRMILMEMAVLLTTLSTAEQIRILNCLELLFQAGASADGPDNRIESITETWYKFLDRGPGLKTVMGFCRNPFPEIKLAGLGVLRSIVDYRWGRDALAETAGLLEYLLDRGVEFNTEAFQAKYDVLQRINNVPNDRFTDQQRQEIQEYIAKGPFYKRGITDISTEQR